LHFFIMLVVVDQVLEYVHKLVQLKIILQLLLLLLYNDLSHPPMSQVLYCWPHEEKANDNDNNLACVLYRSTIKSFYNNSVCYEPYIGEA
jgi:hypothetical protein